MCMMMEWDEHHDISSTLYHMIAHPWLGCTSLSLIDCWLACISFALAHVSWERLCMYAANVICEQGKASMYS
jgi:glutathione S-transferase